MRRGGSHAIIMVRVITLKVPVTLTSFDTYSFKRISVKIRLSWRFFSDYQFVNNGGGPPLIKKIKFISIKMATLQQKREIIEYYSGHFFLTRLNIEMEIAGTFFQHLVAR